MCATSTLVLIAPTKEAMTAFSAIVTILEVSSSSSIQSPAQAPASSSNAPPSVEVLALGENFSKVLEKI